MIKDLISTLRLVWDASALHSSIILISSLLTAFAPAATLWIGKLLLDAVALATQGKLEGGLGALTTLLAVQVGIGAFQGAPSSNDSCTMKKHECLFIVQ